MTLEPCAHVGKTPPCAEALVAAGIKRCVIAAPDPDARVNGAGAARLRAAGIEVVEGVLRQQAYLQLSGFMTRIQQARPRVTMKIAMSEDGFIAARAGQQTWLTGEMAKRWTYDLRSRNDVILTGSGTALIDNPLLTCRAPLELRDSPKRVVLDRQLSLPLNSQFVQTAKDLPLLIVVSEAVSDSARAPYIEAGVEFMTGSVSNEMFDLPALLANLAVSGVNTLMVEAGARLNQSFIASRLVDEICVLHAPIRLGEGGLPAVAGAVGLETLLERDYIKAETKKLGPDRLERWNLK